MTGAIPPLPNAFMECTITTFVRTPVRIQSVPEVEGFRNVVRV